VEKKTNIVVIVIYIIVTVALCVGSYLLGRSHSGTDSGTGRELSEAARVNQQLGAEQQRTVEVIERIRGITEETDSSLRELGEANRRASDISAQIRAEAVVLANYFRSVSDIVNNYTDNMRGE